MPNDSVRSFVSNRALTIVADLGPKELTSRYLTAANGFKLGDDAWYFGTLSAVLAGSRLASSDVALTGPPLVVGT